MREPIFAPGHDLVRIVGIEGDVQRVVGGRGEFRLKAEPEIAGRGAGGFQAKVLGKNPQALGREIAAGEAFLPGAERVGERRTVEFRVVHARI